jgi:hypothetical protein
MKVQFNRHTFRTLQPARLLSKEEWAFLQFLLQSPFPGDKELQRQLDVARVSVECDTCPTIAFTVDTSIAPPASLVDRVPIEAESSGAARDDSIHVLLHVVDGYLSELEVYRNDLGLISSLPSTSALDIITIGTEP